MILTRSPYYLNIDWISPSGGGTPEKYIVQLFIWSGLKASVPAEPTYEIENKNPLGRTGSAKIDISNYINDDLNVSLESDITTNVINSNSAIWVKSQVIYYISGVAQSPEYVSTDLAIKGYGYSIEGENTTIPSNNVLTSANSIKVSKNSNVNIPIKVSETLTTNITVVSYPNNIINKSFDIIATTNSNELVQNVFVNCIEMLTDTSIQIAIDGVVVKELIYKEELKYTPIDIWFLNKYGQLDTITFFKDKIESLKVESEEYERSGEQPINGFHQYEKFNTNGKTEYKINSGWVKESNNEIFKQLFLSNKVWEFNGSIFTPINLKSTNLEYQTRQRDRLLNYEVSFEYAFSEINSI